MVSRLSELPDLLAVAMRRAGELVRAARALTTPVGQAPTGSDPPAANATKPWRFVGHGDLRLLLEPAVADVPCPTSQAQWSLVWLPVEPERAWRGSDGDLGPMAAGVRWSSDLSVGPSQRAGLIDFAVRLLLACARTVPGGLVLVSPPASAACAGARLLLQAIAGDVPSELFLHHEPNAPRVWACHWRPGGRGLPTTTGEPRGPSPSPGQALKSWLRVASRPEQGALVLRPDPAALSVLQDWQGPCTISHTDPLVLALMRERMVLDLWRGVGSPREPPVAQEAGAGAAWTFDALNLGRSRPTR